MGDSGAKGEEYRAKAEKKLKGFALFGNKYEDAVELLEKAANFFKLAKMWKDAGETYRLLSDCHLKLDSKHEAASALVDAANAYKKTSKKDSAKCLHKAAEYFTDLGRLSIAAKHFKDMGDIFEEQQEFADAIEMYSKAADLYSGEEVTSTSNGCKLKVAQLSAQVEDYPTAVQLFTEVALSSLDSNLLKYSVKGYLLCAGLAVLCSADSVGVANAIDKYVDMDATFEDSREHKLLVELAECMEGGDVDKFTSVVQEFDSMSRLDQWKTTMLLRAKKRCAAREMAGGDDEDLT